MVPTLIFVEVVVGELIDTSQSTNFFEVSKHRDFLVQSNLRLRLPLVSDTSPQPPGLQNFQTSPSHNLELLVRDHDHF